VTGFGQIVRSRHSAEPCSDDCDFHIIHLITTKDIKGHARKAFEPLCSVVFFCD